MTIEDVAIFDISVGAAVVQVLLPLWIFEAPSKLLVNGLASALSTFCRVSTLTCFRSLQKCHQKYAGEGVQFWWFRSYLIFIIQF